MIVKYGGSALSHAQRKSLKERIQKTGVVIDDINAQYVHLIDAQEVDKTKENILNSLLAYGEDYQETEHTQTFFVVPRIGTQSAWGSKATDIVRLSGIYINRIERGVFYKIKAPEEISRDIVADSISDRMSEVIVLNPESVQDVLFEKHQPKELTFANIIKGGIGVLQTLNATHSIGLGEDDIQYIYDECLKISHNPTDVELMMYAQINSEHCRHKIFNAAWEINGKPEDESLFKKIRNTLKDDDDHVISAYSDNAAVTKGEVARFFRYKPDGTYGFSGEQPVHLVSKVETHNHPTAISPDPGAATGIGGEIRDEAATGIGARSKMGLTGFSVSSLGFLPYELEPDYPSRIADAKSIMIEAPLGGASYADEFGRANLSGYFRSFEQVIEGKRWGYHKPIMLAGGLGNISENHTKKNKIKEGDLLIVLGGPAMLIGLGGGAASSSNSGDQESSLDFASVQRANAEVERRAQEVINTCIAQEENNPIISIHDVGAGGLSNAFPELVHDAGMGAIFQLGDIPSADPSMSPLEIWCNEAQERYVLALDPKDLDAFQKLCDRERCLFAVVGVATKEQTLKLLWPEGEEFEVQPVDVPMSLLFNNNRRLKLEFDTQNHTSLQASQIALSVKELADKVLSHPTVASKKFLITIGDRSVGGLTVRDQFVGKWQIPVSDVAVTAATFGARTGEAMAIGERTPIAVTNPAAASRMAIAEALTNIMAAPIDTLSRTTLSANWMAAVSEDGQKQSLHEAVEAASQFAQELDVTIPVGKDSLSMKTAWSSEGTEKTVSSPVSLVVSAFAPVKNVDKTMTPVLVDIPSKIVLIDLGRGSNRLAGSIAQQVAGEYSGQTPDVDSDDVLALWDVIQKLSGEGKILAYHDRSDGGLFATAAEMMFAGRLGVQLDLFEQDVEAFLFNEEIGVLLQVADEDIDYVTSEISRHFGRYAGIIGSVINEDKMIVTHEHEIVYEQSREHLERQWNVVSDKIRALRENPETVDQEAKLIEGDNAGLFVDINFEVPQKSLADTKSTHKVAILREQGVNSNVEMAAGFTLAGFEAHDVHMSDLIDGTKTLSDYNVLVACGGFSYGDVLGAGNGWAKVILSNPALKEMFRTFFEREDTLTLGVCNGCQMLSALKEIIPGTTHWPTLHKNKSDQFEARTVSVKIDKSPSVFLNGMEGSVVTIPVAHGEGQMIFDDQQTFVCARYVDDKGNSSEKYPYNPNGTIDGATAVCSEDGRVTIMMPHPERAIFSRNHSWHPKEWGEYSPWFKLFTNAYDWLDK